MSLNDTMTALMDKARKLTGLTEKIGIVRLTDLMDHFDLHINPNLLSVTQGIAPAAKASDQWPMWQNYIFDQVLTPGTYTFSWQAKADSSSNDGHVRIRIFDDADNAVIPEQQNRYDSSGKDFLLTDKRQSYTFTVPNNNEKYRIFCYGSAWNVGQYWNVTFYNCKLEVGDLATPFEKVGDGN